MRTRLVALGLVVLVVTLFLPSGGGGAALADDDKKDEALVTRIMDVGSLTGGRPDFYRELSMSAEPGVEEEQPLFGAEAEEPWYPVGQVDELIELIKGHVRPETWESTLGASIRSISEQTLIVRSFPDVVDAVARYLGELQRRMMRRVCVDVETFRLSAEGVRRVLVEGSTFLAKPTSIETLRGSEQAGPSVSLTVYERSRAAVFAGTQRAYVGEYDVEVAWGSKISDPVVFVDNAGLAADVRAILGPKGKTVLLTVGAALSELVELERVDAGEKRIIEAPQNLVANVQSRVELPVGAWALLEGQSTEGDDTSWVFAVRVTALPLDDLADTARAVSLTVPEAKPSRTFELRSFDIAMLDHAVQSRLGEDLFLMPSNYMPPSPPELPEPAPILPVDAIVELIRDSIVPDSWELRGTYLEARNGILFARNAPDVLDAIESRLATLRRELIWSTVTTAEVVDVPDALGRRLQSAPDRVVSAEGLKAIADAVSTGKARRLGSTRVAAMRGARNAVTSGRRTAYLADYEVEIAGESTIANPIVQRCLSGAGLDVLPHLTTCGQAVDTVLRYARTRVRTPLRSVDTPHGPLRVPEMDMLRLRAALQVPLGKTMIAASAGGDGRRRLLLVTTRLRRAAR